jgi:uncharacterized protein (TIGR02145 family)
VKKIINSSKRTCWFTFSIAFLTYLLFFVFPSCQKDDSALLTQESLTGLTTAAISTNTGTLYYGHKIFTRSTRAPFVETLKLENPDFNCFDGNFVLKIQNGSDKKTRVSSAEIWIDGVLVVGPSDFSKNVSLIIKPLSGLTPESILGVKLNSTPGSFIDLWIEGTIIVITPTYAQIGPLCQNSTAPELPLGSTNTPAIIGTWDPATINTATVGTTKYTFTPDEGQCGTTVTMDIEVTTPITPTFTTIGPLLLNSSAPGLPTTSINGITGTWIPETINTTAEGTFTFTFTPTTGQCATTAIMDIEVTNIGEVTDKEGNVYKTVKIGGQWWMAENLKTTLYNNGDPIDYPGTDNIAWSKNITGAYAWYLNDEATYKNTYGALYNWYAINKGNLCPTGWSVPDVDDWTILETYLTDNGYGFDGSGNDIAKSMAATSGWGVSGILGTVGNDQPSNNRSGFTGLPGGYRHISGEFYDYGNYGYWWSSSEYDYLNGNYRCLIYSFSDLHSGITGKMYGKSIRCVKN